MAVNDNIDTLTAPFVATIYITVNTDDITPYLPDGITEQQVIRRLSSLYEGNMWEDIKWAIQDIEECGE